MPIIQVYSDKVDIRKNLHVEGNITFTGSLYDPNGVFTGGTTYDNTNRLDYEFLSEPIGETEAEVNIVEPTSSPSVSKVFIDSEYKYMTFPYTSGANNTAYNITFNEDTECDILIVGGGGGGDGEIGGGGGGGAVLYAQNVIIQPNTYTINVGKGGAENNNGNNSTAFGATCLGGGSTLRVAWIASNNGRSGGSGSGGGSGNTGTATGFGGGVGTSTKGSLLSTATLYNGNSGGDGGDRGGSDIGVCSGGGGGANEVGKSTTNTVRYNNASNYTAWFNAGADGSGGDGILINIT